MKTLYLLKTAGLGNFYVIAETATEAQMLLEKELNDADYGFYDSRIVTEIHILTNQMQRYSQDNKMKFLDKAQRLLITDNKNDGKK